MTESSFHDALTHRWDEYLFRFVPVEWWDEAANVWRPTIIDGDFAIHHERGMVPVVMPCTVGDAKPGTECTVQNVKVGNLRFSWNVSETTQRFALFRYTLELLELLSPCFVGASQDIQQRFTDVAESVLLDYQTALGAWKHEFSFGVAATQEQLLPETDNIEVSGRIYSHFLSGECTDTLREYLLRVTDEDGASTWSPVAWWDEKTGMWHPTLMRGKVEHNDELLPSRMADILVPDNGDVKIRSVSCGDLRLEDVRGIALSMYPVPILAHEVERMKYALRILGWKAEFGEHPMVDGLQSLFDGAVEEWSAEYLCGMPGSSPSPRVQLLAPSFWGCTEEVAPEDDASAHSLTGGTE